MSQPFATTRGLTPILSCVCYYNPSSIVYIFCFLSCLYKDLENKSRNSSLQVSKSIKMPSLLNTELAGVSAGDDYYLFYQNGTGILQAHSKDNNKSWVIENSPIANNALATGSALTAYYVVKDFNFKNMPTVRTNIRDLLISSSFSYVNTGVTDNTVSFIFSIRTMKTTLSRRSSS